MAALRGFSVADAIHTDNLGKTKKATVKEAKKKATESIKLIKKKEKGTYTSYILHSFTIL
jgi:hypothetical protein